MTTKINILTFVKLIGIIGVIAVLTASCHHEGKEALKTKIFKTGNGYGYAIGTAKDTLIKQPFIPAISGNTPFCDSLDALKVSRLVIERIKKEKSPVITKEDLASLNIKTKC